VPDLRIADPRECQCGEVLTGAIKPWECRLFGNGCSPATPMGALMVSSEGSCAAYYRYGDVERLKQRRRESA
jgi:hydrogenase expression/formation protein HypD